MGYHKFRNRQGRPNKSPSPSMAQAIEVRATAPNLLPALLAQVALGRRSSGFAPLRRGAHPHCARPQTLAWCLGFAPVGSRNVAGSRPLAEMRPKHFACMCARASGRRAQSIILEELCYLK